MTGKHQVLLPEVAAQRAGDAVEYLLAVFRERHRAGALQLPDGDLYLANLGCAVIHAKSTDIPLGELLRLAAELYVRLGVAPYKPD